MKLSPELIVNSFKCCGINLKNDGSEDNLIHCFKQKQPCESGAEILKSQLSVLEEPLRSNPFEEITDSDVQKAQHSFFQIDEDMEEELNILD